MNPFSDNIQQQLKHDTPYAWFLRHQASTSPIFRRQHLAELDERLEAYLDCYLISEQAGKSLLAQLNLTDWGAIFVTALIALRTNNSEALNIAIDAVEEEQQGRELSDAFCWAGFDRTKPYFDQLIQHDNALIRATIITVAGHFTPRINQSILEKLLQDKSPEVIVATLKIIGENKLHDYNETITTYFSHDNEAIRFQAAFTGSLLGLSDSLNALQAFCFKETPYLREALGLLYQVVAESQINNALTAIQKGNFSPRIKAYNIAMAGRPEWIPILIEWMKDPEYAPLAGEAFSFITGADIEEDDLSILNVELCESQDAPLAEKRKQDPWTQVYENDLAWPDATLVTAWWGKNKQHFQEKQRYLAGMTLTKNHLEQIIQTGTQPQRHIANLILAVQEPDRLMFSVYGKTF